jgi:predicted metal-binding protein
MAAKSKKKKISKSKSRQAAEIQAAMDYGIDVSMLIENVSRSCTERIIRHQIALNTVEKLWNARRPRRL